VSEKINSKEDLLVFALAIVRKLEKLIHLNKKISTESITSIRELRDPSKIADNIAIHLNLSINEKQELLEFFDLRKKLEKIMQYIDSEISVLSMEKRIRGRVKTQMEKTQREYYLNEQLKAIQKELGEIEEGKDEVANLQRAIVKAKMPKEVLKKCLSELKKLKSMSPMSAESTVVRNYLDWMIDLPWSVKSKIHEDIKETK
jgi:ATP-dependent Lon protease